MLIGAALLGIGMLPGSIDGSYGAIAQSCMCDSNNFMQFRDGKLISYQSNHPPAQLIGRYETEEDGRVSVYMFPSKKGDPEKLIFRARPRLWFTSFEDKDGDESSWHRKTIFSNEVNSIVSDQEIELAQISDDEIGRFVEKRYFDQSLTELRTEIVRPKRSAEQDVTPNR